MATNLGLCQKALKPLIELSLRVLLISFPYLSKSAQTELCGRPSSATGGTQQSWKCEYGDELFCPEYWWAPTQNIFIILLWNNLNANFKSLKGSADSTSLAVLTLISFFYFFGVPLLPEALCLLCEGPWVPSIGWLIQLGQQCLAGLLARVVRKLDCNWFCGTRRLLTVQTLDGLLSLNAPVKTNEANPSGNAWGESMNKRLVICWVSADSCTNTHSWSTGSTSLT